MNVWHQFLGSLTRFALAWLVGVLVARKVISTELADAVVESAAGVIALFLLAALPLVWAYLKARFVKYMVREAIEANPLSTVESVQQKVSEKKGLTVTSV